MASPSLNANKKPSWIAKRIKGIAANIWPEVFEQEPIAMGASGVINPKIVRDGKGNIVRKTFGEFSGSPSPFVIERPSGGNQISAERAILNNKGFVYAAVNAKAREVMAIDWRLFQVDGDDHEEKKDNEILDLLDGPNDNMNGLEFKYLLSACLDLAGNAFVWLEGVKNDLDKPKALHLMPVDRVNVVIDRRSWPYQLMGYKLKLETKETAFEPYEVIHFRMPNVQNHFEGWSPVMAGAEYIDNDNYAMEFNRKFFINGARPSMWLKTKFIAETQIDSLKIGFADTHQGIDNMNRIGVLPDGVEPAVVGASPKDMDFKNMSQDMRDRILAMFGVSRTILGTAESDTNRATSETADYVFSKRVVKPHMMNIVATLNDRLIPRYGDDLYISFIDPVPEDKQFRIIEMQAMMGSQPVIAANEARDIYAGMGPVDGGDQLMRPSTMVPVGRTQTNTDPEVQPQDDPNAKVMRKNFGVSPTKAANGLRVAYRPPRTKLQSLAKRRAEQRQSLADKIKADLEAKLREPSKKFESTREQDEKRWKEWSEYTQAAEKELDETMRKFNDEQRKEVIANLPHAVKAVDPSKLFDKEKWIQIAVDATAPIITNLFEEQAKQGAAEIGSTFDFTQATREAVHESVQRMSESYTGTTLEALESHINEGLQAGEPLADITKRVEQVYQWSNESRAKQVAKTEAFRSANAALKESWKQSGVVKTVRWYTATNPCPFCQTMEGKAIPIDDVFFKNGESVTNADGSASMSLDYGDVGFPPLHPNCMCYLRPDQISI